jgi:hypothetical protein
MSNPHEIERLLHHLPTVARCEDEWTRGFAQSVLRQARRPQWRPTPKQLAMMRTLVNGLFAQEEPALIE